MPIRSLFIGGPLDEQFIELRDEFLSIEVPATPMSIDALVRLVAATPGGHVHAELAEVGPRTRYELMFVDGTGVRHYHEATGRDTDS